MRPAFPNHETHESQQLPMEIPADVVQRHQDFYNHLGKLTLIEAPDEAAGVVDLYPRDVSLAQPQDRSEVRTLKRLQRYAEVRDLEQSRGSIPSITAIETMPKGRRRLFGRGKKSDARQAELDDAHRDLWVRVERGEISREVATERMRAEERANDLHTVRGQLAEIDRQVKLGMMDKHTAHHLRNGLKAVPTRRNKSAKRAEQHDNVVQGINNEMRRVIHRGVQEHQLPGQSTPENVSWSPYMRGLYVEKLARTIREQTAERVHNEVESAGSRLTANQASIRRAEIANRVRASLIRNYFAPYQKVPVRVYNEVNRLLDEALAPKATAKRGKPAKSQKIEGHQLELGLSGHNTRNKPDRPDAVRPLRSAEKKDIPDWVRVSIADAAGFHLSDTVAEGLVSRLKKHDKVVFDNFRNRLMASNNPAHQAMKDELSSTGKIPAEVIRTLRKQSREDIARAYLDELQAGGSTPHYGEDDVRILANAIAAARDLESRGLTISAYLAL